MRISHWKPAAALSSLICLSQLPLVSASPVSLEDPDIEKRCANPCGFYSQLCCTSSQTCITNNGQAVCSDGGSGSSGSSGSGDGDYDYFTSTYTVKETDAATYTTTWSARRSPAPTGSGSGGGASDSGSSGSCDATVGESICGNSCCGPSQVCDNGQCILGSSSIWATATAAATPPVRGTSEGLATVTETGSPTITQAFETPVSTDGSPALGIKAPSDKGLSGGAIAGIVIGTIAGVALLLLICACLCCRGIIDGLLACFGCGKRRRRDDQHHSHGGGGGRRTWFGSKPHHGDHSDDGGEKKKWGGLAAIGIMLGALALCLGIKKHREHDEKSSYSYPSSYYYSDYYTNSSSASSDRRTRETRRTRDSRQSRRSRARSRRS